MLKINNKLQLMSQVAHDAGEGTLIAIYNDIEQEWHYYVGNFKPKNPSNHIHYNSINGKCIDYIVENEHTFFAGEFAKGELIKSHIYEIEREEKEFDFRFVWFKG